MIEFDLPTGFPEGSYDLIVSDATGCVPVLEDAFFVEADTDLQLVDIDPGFGWTDAPTAVTVTASGTPALENPPLVYLSPLIAGPTTTASELRAVSWVDDATLDAVVPSGLSVDEYNVVVVNPTTGEVGILAPPDGFRIVADETPFIDSVAPGTIPSATTSVTVFGGAFGDPLADPAPIVDLECYDPSLDDCTSSGNGSFNTLTNLTVNAWDSTSIDFDAPAAPSAAACAG